MNFFGTLPLLFSQGNDLCLTFLSPKENSNIHIQDQGGCMLGWE